MLKLQNSLLATACVALVGMACFAPGAGATTCQGDTNCSLGANPYTFNSATDVFGGGSSLVAPYWRQTGDCYSSPADLITKGSPPTYVDEILFDYPGQGTTHKGAQDCVSTEFAPGSTTWYISTGSGSGILGVFSHDPISFYGEVNAQAPQNFPEVFYGLSDAGLGSTDVTAYDQGGVYHQSTTTITISAPGAVSCSSSGEPYPNPAYCYGPLVQFPFSIDPVAQVYPNKGIYAKLYNPTTKKELDYSFNVFKGGANGGLRLSANSLCGIWNGQITNWNDTSLTTDNNNTSLKSTKDTTTSGWSVPLYAVARSDSSGTTSIVTRHLANVCSGFGGNLYTTGATTIAGAGAGSIVGNTYNVNNPNWPGVDVSGKITLAPNSAGIAQYVAFTQTVGTAQGDACNTSQNAHITLPAGYADCITQGRIGYDGADYVLPYVKSSKTNTFNLYGATLQNSSLAWIAPSPSAAAFAFTGIQPPQSNSKGLYCASCTTFGLRNDPTAWVENLSPGEALANPTNAKAYPLVGTTNFLGYTCYANAGPLGTLTGQLAYVETQLINTDPSKGVLSSAGLSPLPAQWRAAINQTFITNSANEGLQMTTVNGSAACQASNGISGA